MNQYYWTNWLSEWFNNPLIKTVACLVPEWINIFEQIDWLNESINDLLIKSRLSPPTGFNSTGIFIFLFQFNSL